MDENKWIINTTKMTTHFEANPDSPQKLAVMSLIDAGNADVSTQDNAWNAITAMMRGVENSPIGRGRQADLPADLIAGLDAYGVNFHASQITYYDALTATCGSDSIRGRGGIQYSSAQEYADAEWKTEKNSLIRAYRANESPKDTDRVLWDGSFNKKGQLSGVTYNPKATTEDA